MEKGVLFCCGSWKPVLWCARTLFIQRSFGQSLYKYAVRSQFRNINSVSLNTQQCSKQQYQRSCKYLSNSGKLTNDPQLTGVFIKYEGSIYRLGERQFHTTGRRDAFPPFVWVVVSLVSKAGAVLSGRKYRSWLKTRPVEVQKKHHKRVVQFWAALAAFGTALAMIYYNSHVQECPITGRKRFITLTKQQYIKVADYQSESFLESFDKRCIPPTHPLYNIVLKTAQRIVNANQDFPGMKDQKWVIHVVQDPEKNAFVLANGHIFVHTGILEFVENEDQFAFILAHEMSHALLLHGVGLCSMMTTIDRRKLSQLNSPEAEQLSYSQFLDYIVIGVMAAIWTLMPNDGIAVVANWFYEKVMNLSVHMPYSRVLEKEADRIGLHLTAKACFDVRESSVLWHRMGISDDITGEGKIPEWLSTHPSHGNRVKNMNQLIPKAIEERTACKCDPLPEVDPRTRATHLRKLADNIMIARASKVNIDRVQKVKPKPVIPAFQPFPDTRKSLDKS